MCWGWSYRPPSMPRSTRPALACSGCNESWCELVSELAPADRRIAVMTEFITVQLEKNPRGFATLWLNRPEKNNAFNAEMIHELILALNEVQSDKSLRFLLLRGRGKHFSAGADLAWMQDSARLDYIAEVRDAHDLGELMHKHYHLGKPTLAVVQGAASGGALGLVACRDIPIAAAAAQQSLCAVSIGLA